MCASIFVLMFIKFIIIANIKSRLVFSSHNNEAS